jgi:hypothetical protein
MATVWMAIPARAAMNRRLQWRHAAAGVGTVGKQDQHLARCVAGLEHADAQPRASPIMVRPPAMPARAWASSSHTVP